MLDIDSLKFGADGLIPAVVQDYFSKRVLTLAYMNRESLAISMREGFTCFYSRSRQTQWRKGETSGNAQEIVSITADCDADALVVEVIPAGPACHTGSESCFSNPVFQSETRPAFSMDGLFALIDGRKSVPVEGSYTTYLFSKGLDKILKKVGEECAEVIIAAKGGDRQETVFEIADLSYHLLVLMAQAGIAPADVIAQLASRHVVDHKVKQETMK
jgi:phosphoribosyl-AMP cyclohydrolase / phosphoribosyl-ATP pyrophosphohydrolase